MRCGQQKPHSPRCLSIWKHPLRSTAQRNTRLKRKMNCSQSHEYHRKLSSIICMPKSLDSLGKLNILVHFNTGGGCQRTELNSSCPRGGGWAETTCSRTLATTPWVKRLCFSHRHLPFLLLLSISDTPPEPSFDGRPSSGSHTRRASVL